MCKPLVLTFKLIGLGWTIYSFQYHCQDADIACNEEEKERINSTVTFAKFPPQSSNTGACAHVRWNHSGCHHWSLELLEMSTSGLFQKIPESQLTLSPQCLEPAPTLQHSSHLCVLLGDLLPAIFSLTLTNTSPSGSNHVRCIRSHVTWSCYRSNLNVTLKFASLCCCHIRVPCWTPV